MYNTTGASSTAFGVTGTSYSYPKEELIEMIRESQNAMITLSKQVSENTRALEQLGQKNKVKNDELRSEFVCQVIAAFFLYKFITYTYETQRKEV
jgi:hypothetical protein